ncbi:hypothetical protein LIA77_08613 [Sarocladium implicatum]|nr:hypothetical protein LIA77_08613 [Sarocladium implicatum]
MALRSPVGVSSHQVEGTVAARQPQPTYTTAGTIYNPNSSQPLQPPARRGRFSKWNSGLPAELSLLPKSMLSALPLHISTHGSTRPGPLAQYSPLQQNYDRAVSPTVVSPKIISDRVAAQTPRMFSPSLTGTNFADEHDHSDSSDDDEEIELRLKPLLSMPVKSLQNLASYPNPEQKRAQKVILRGVRSNLAANNVLGPNPNGHNTSSKVGDSPFGRSARSSRPAPNQQQLSEVEPSPPKSTMQDFKFVNQKQMRASLYRSSTNGSAQDENPGYTTLAIGPGAPLPLTAGPPGQRQYRPSTFDATFKALRAKDLGSGLAEEATSVEGDPETMSSDKSEPDTASIDYMGMLLGDSTPCEPSDEFNNYYYRQPQAQESPTLHRSRHFMSPQEQMNGYSNYADEYYPLASEWNSGEPLGPWPQLQTEPLAPLTAEERLQLRLMRVNEAWQRGRFYYTTADYVPRAQTSPLGAVGERVPSMNGSKVDKQDDERLSIAEANQLSAAEHAKPLLDLVLRSLERNLAYQQFWTPDPSLVDQSPEGNRSLFGKGNAKEAGAR